MLKQKVAPIFAALVAIGLACALSSCGTNVFVSQEKEDPAEDATIALEQDDPDKAIKILNDALSSDDSNPV
jgi:hypothetical protein